MCMRFSPCRSLFNKIKDTATTLVPGSTTSTPASSDTRSGKPATTNRPEAPVAPTMGEARRGSATACIYKHQHAKRLADLCTSTDTALRTRTRHHRADVHPHPHPHSHHAGGGGGLLPNLLGRAVGGLLNAAVSQLGAQLDAAAKEQAGVYEEAAARLQVG